MKISKKQYIDVPIFLDFDHDTPIGKVIIDKAYEAKFSRRGLAVGYKIERGKFELLCFGLTPVELISCVPLLKNVKRKNGVILGGDLEAISLQSIDF